MKKFYNVWMMIEECIYEDDKGEQCEEYHDMDYCRKLTTKDTLEEAEEFIDDMAEADFIMCNNYLESIGE